MNSQTRFRSLQTTALMALLFLAVFSPRAAAAPLYWGQTAYSSGSIYVGTAATPGNWFTDASGTTPSGAGPNSTNDLIFNTTGNNLGGDVTVNAELSARSLTFNTTGATRLVQSGNITLGLGAGGITLGASSGNVTIGTGNFLTTRLTTSQTWTNNSTSTLTVRSLATYSGAGATTLTLNATGTGAISFSQNITENSGDPLALVIDSAGAGLTSIFGTSNTYSGGTTIKRGALSAYGTLGSGEILLGDTTGSSAAILNVRSGTSNAVPFTNNITVRAGSSGAKTLTTNASGGVVLNGTLTLDDNLAFTASTDGTIAGAISGTGDLVKGGNAALILTGDSTSSGDLTINAGAFTLTDTGSLTFTIGADGVNNQLNGSSTGAVTLNGTFNFNILGSAYVDGNSWSIVTVSNETYGATFAVSGFTQVDNIWTNGSGFTFTESTGMLTYAVPEPSTFAFLIGGALCVFAFGSRRVNRVRACR